MKTSVFFGLELYGIHAWNECNIEEVSYLKEYHRHKFIIKGYKDVSHLNRDIEFIVLKNEVNNFLFKKFYSTKYNCLAFDNLSCEQIGLLLMNEFSLSKVEVSEDGENGALVEL